MTRVLISEEKKYRSIRDQLRGCKGPWEDMTLEEFANYWDEIEYISNQAHLYSDKQYLKKLEDKLKHEASNDFHFLQPHELPATFLVQFGKIGKDNSIDWAGTCHARIEMDETKNCLVAKEVIRLPPSGNVVVEGVEAIGLTKGVYTRSIWNDEGKLDTSNKKYDCFRIWKSNVCY